MKKTFIITISLIYLISCILGLSTSFSAILYDEELDLVAWGIITLILALSVLFNSMVLMSKENIRIPLLYNKYFALFQMFFFKILGLSYIFQLAPDLSLYFMQKENSEYGFEYHLFNYKLNLFYSTEGNNNTVIAINIISVGIYVFLSKILKEKDPLLEKGVFRLSRKANQ
jgi:hypothetical protein